ncbi:MULTISPECIES: helix-turn-helix domain-containing protein [unclassified Streptomyces]|uniref:helix-turn-helix domain-containing protein n=1 Tax=unclassified Streptomyces TaxID=2593676 RepID=UPI0011C85B16|nr:MULTISPECIES: helix-turn-helix domain-containing protein [unclassified Streptomyces]TXS17255.1 DNA-binding protein [Streptomyces sp. wa22]WSQ79024.1 helix-turn-helix domain-containing protein [Streptomyces sp. NBC_01213]WSQ86393.1 helix-turn-helix domain-containing protein [Streptomyces sp. NBC_01212]
MAEQTGAEVAPARLYRPDEVAAVLGCSAWWVKDRARRRQIPFARVGRAYRFTAAHLAEIIRLHEERPAVAARPPSLGAPPAAPARRSSAPEPGAPSGRLRARPPRRSDRAAFDTAA